MDQMCVWWCAGMCITILLSLCVFTDVYCISPLIDIIKCNITYWKTMMCRDTSCCAACVLYRYIYILYSVTYFETNFICKYQSHDCHVTRWLLHSPTDYTEQMGIYLSTFELISSDMGVVIRFTSIELWKYKNYVNI